MAFLTCREYPTGIVGNTPQVVDNSKTLERFDVMRNIKEMSVFISDERANGKIYRTITDKETGEIISQRWIVEQSKMPGRPQGGKKAHFYKVYATNWREIIKKKELKLHEVGLLSSLMIFLSWQSAFLVDPETGRAVNESRIADILGYDRGHLHEVLERLIAKGLVAKVTKGNGRGNNYMLNTNLFFFGNTILDINEHNAFLVDCEYDPAIKIKYRQTEKK